MLEFMKNHPGATVIISCVIVALLALIAWIIWANKAPVLTKISIESNTQGLKIVHISDFHNTRLQNNNEELIALVRDAQPDIIAITGDLVDSRHTNIKRATDFVSELVKIAPCYYVAGNHESRIRDEYEKLKSALAELGVTILCDECAEYEKDGQIYTIIGIEDPMFILEKDSTEMATAVVAGKLLPLAEQCKGYTIVLCHRPEVFSAYVDAKIDLALTGHAHGGQMQIPFIGGLIAPNQGFFPKYSEGLHTEGKTNMVISRGIGNSLCPIRVNNRPEVILIELT